MKKINVIDIFAGCGGLSEGFKNTGAYDLVGAVEWERAPSFNLINRLRTKWNYEDAKERVLIFDIQRTQELFNGWHNDEKYGTHIGLDKLVDHKKIDLIIGGPPCQAYSIAGRIRDEHGMQYDYRNYLFESYMKVVKRYQPEAFVFENVPGILSASPGGIPVTTLIKKEIEEAGYEILDNLQEHALIDLTEYGVPQKRSRVIIFAVKKSSYNNPKEVLLDFYHKILPSYKESNKLTVRDAIGDLPPLYPVSEEFRIQGKKYSHQPTNISIHNHLPRFHNKRDIGIFYELAADIENQSFKYVSTEALKRLYTERTGNISNVHKYYVLRWDGQSNTIPAHLYKDGLRHIHPDPNQARSLTVREAGRLQTFPDDYEFISSAGDNYKMIGNAVPPKFAEKLANAVKEILVEMNDQKKELDKNNYYVKI
ncbi:DNA (cytosine-5)-methyltransferase 1 [Peribacillus frigoritolerans]|uniref:DNA cytosine methyltransferase n=1 Tax=Peribacillus frigoritolerans TaxID=450367 RepID=UPI00119A23D7|nr:DNA cytosine methyltransferase [Peribacillus frigoritolerans]TWE03637.1 DNA (cytosine-5)-methyltransferase 1 [Peribacillus frigoritolerans]